MGTPSFSAMFSKADNFRDFLFAQLEDKVFRKWYLSYFFGYKTGFFPFQNNPKDLDPSYKTDLDLWDRLGRVKLVLQQNFKGLI